MAKFRMKPKSQTNTNSKEYQISNKTQTTNERQISKEHQISKETQITNEPQTLKEHQITKKTTNFKRSPNF